MFNIKKVAVVFVSFKIYLEYFAFFLFGKKLLYWTHHHFVQFLKTIQNKREKKNKNKPGTISNVVEQQVLASMAL